ncbi:MAG: hypothetical protein ACP5R5_15000, partial [Armatimonadota bacterium]
MRRKLDRCAAVGMKLNYDIKLLTESLESDEQEEALRSEVNAIKDHPALLAWYISDEPELRKIPPERLARAYRIIKGLDPVHPVAMCIALVSRAPQYVDAMDVLMVDIYPVPHQPVTAVAEGVDKALAAVTLAPGRESGTDSPRTGEGSPVDSATLSPAGKDAGLRKPVWFIPQAFGGGEFWYREPTAREVRVMTYLALIHGATGIQYFIRRPPTGNPKSPVVWSECRTLAMECSQLAPAILSGNPAPKVVCEPEQIHARAWMDRGMLFVIAVNTKNEPTALRLTLEGCGYSGKADLIFERRKVDVVSGGIADIIDAMDSRIYRVPIGPFPEEDIKISPDSIVANPSFEEIVSPGTPASCYIWNGEVEGAICTIDPYVARHGRQSVRMTVPASGSGVVLVPLLLADPTVRTKELSQDPWPFWLKYKAGARYRASVWAKSQTPGVQFRFTDAVLDGFPRTFALSTEWQRYEAEGVAKRDKPYSSLGIQLLGPGTAWFDVFEVIQAGDNTTSAPPAP